MVGMMIYLYAAQRVVGKDDPPVPARFEKPYAIDGSKRETARRRAIAEKSKPFGARKSSPPGVDLINPD
jgi:hypothetical protein